MIKLFLQRRIRFWTIPPEKANRLNYEKCQLPWRSRRLQSWSFMQLYFTTGLTRYSSGVCCPRETTRSTSSCPESQINLPWGGMWNTILIDRHFSYFSWCISLDAIKSNGLAKHSGLALCPMQMTLCYNKTQHSSVSSLKRKRQASQHTFMSWCLILISEEMIHTASSVQVPSAAWVLNSGLLLGYCSQNINSDYT